MLLTLCYLNIIFIFIILFSISVLVYNHLKINFIIYNIFYMFMFNEPLTNWLASFWVIPLIIIPFFLVLVLILHLVYTKIYSNTYIILLYLYILFLLFDYIYTKYNLTGLLFINNFEINYENPLLSNFINKYHPFILYSTAGIIFILLFNYINNFFLFAKILFNNTTLYNYNFHLILYNTPLIALTLFLGSFWAVQEVSWGGWWNWDSSENIGLLIGIITLFTLHKLSIVKLDLLWYIYTLKGLLILILLYKSVQLTFDESSHNFNFGSSTLSRLTFCRWDYVSIFYSFSFLFVVKSLVYYIRITLFYTKIFSMFKNHKSSLFWIKNILVLSIIIILFISLDFLWEILFFNYDKPSDDLIYLLWEYFLYLVYLFSINIIISLEYKLFFTPFLLSSFILSLYLYILFNIRYSFYIFLHILIILSIVINFYSKLYNILEISYSNNMFSTNELLKFYSTPIIVNYTLNNTEITMYLSQLTNFTLLTEITGLLNSKKEFINEYVSYLSQTNCFYLTIFFTIENFYTYITLTDNLLIYLIFTLLNFFFIYFILLLQI